MTPLACLANDSSNQECVQLTGSFTVGDLLDAYSSTRDTAIDVANVIQFLTHMAG